MVETRVSYLNRKLKDVKGATIRVIFTAAPDAKRNRNVYQSVSSPKITKQDFPFLYFQFIYGWVSFSGFFVFTLLSSLKKTTPWIEHRFFSDSQ